MIAATRRAAAIHEAGHAVIGRVLGLRCWDVTILPERADELGSAMIDDPRFGWERGDGPRKPIVDAFCIALYAGGEAERVILGSEEVGDAVDSDRATGCLSWIGVRGAGFVGDDVWERYEARLRLRARELVIIHRLVIERVAASLESRGMLKGEEVDRLMIG